MTLKRKERRAEFLMQRLVEARHGEAVARGLRRHVGIDEVDVLEIACVLERGDDDGLLIDLDAACDDESASNACATTAWGWP